MRQTALIYLQVTARLQLIHCFKRRTSHELNFNTQFQLPSLLRAVEIQLQYSNAMFTRNSNTSTKTMVQCKLLLMPCTKEEASLYAKPENPKLHLSARSSITSETGHFDALTYNLYFCAYSSLQKKIKNTLN